MGTSANASAAYVAVFGLGAGGAFMGTSAAFTAEAAVFGRGSMNAALACCFGECIVAALAAFLGGAVVPCGR